tara:strand:+ start:3838 stop:6774 length:2937 start_codon:yes stop_codon:yes gene_type:complete
MSELKTLTYVVKMDIGDGTEKTKQFRTTIKTMEQDAAKASVGIDNLAKTIGEKYNTKVSTAVDQTNTVKNEIKSAAREASRSEKAYSQLSREYTHLANTSSLVGRELQIANAQYKLGAKATDEQKRKIGELVGANYDAIQSKKLASKEQERYNKTLEVFAQDSAAKAELQSKKLADKNRRTALSARQSEKAFAQLSREYTHLASRTGKTADEQEVLNAQYRLGASATKAQKDQAAALVTAYQAQRKAATKTQGSMRGLRGQAQNLGWQMQDVAVQAQMGTNALVILGQQGSQLASGFGPMGALVGAGIAVGAAALGVFSKSMGSTSDLTKKLEERVKGLNEALVKLASDNKTSSLDKSINAKQAEADLEKTTKAMKKLKKSMLGQKEVADADKFYLSVGKGEGVWLDKSKKRRREEALALETSQKKYKDLSDELVAHKKIIEGATEEGTKANQNIKDMIKTLQLEVDMYGESAEAIELEKLTREGASDALINELSALQNLKDKKGEEAEAIKKAKEERVNETKTLEKYLEKITSEYQAIGRSTEETHKHTAALITQDPMYQQMIINILKATEAKKGEIKATQDQIAVNEKLASIGMMSVDQDRASYKDLLKSRLQLLDEQYETEKDRAKQALDFEFGTEEDYYAKLLELKADYEKKKAAIEGKPKAVKDDSEKALQVQAKYDPNVKLALLQRQYAEERALLGDNVEALARIDQHYADERIKINGTVWEKMAVSARESIENTDEMIAESLDRFVDGTAQAFGDAIVFSDNFGDAMKNVFKGAISSMISYFAELAIQQALMWAFTKAGESTLKAEQASSQSFINQASVFEAGLNAFKSTAAIPVIGPSLAPGAATAAIGYAQPMAAAANTLNFAGAFDSGGMIPSGSAGIVSEFGDELVGGTMIYNGSQGSLGVTGREDTAKKMGSSNNNISVNSYGNASPDAIARAMVRQLKKPNKAIDNAVYDSMNRGRKNGGKRFNA